MKTTTEFTNLLITLLQGIANGHDDLVEETIDELREGLPKQCIASFGEEELMTPDEGLIVTFKNKRFQINIV